MLVDDAEAPLTGQSVRRRNTRDRLTRSARVVFERDGFLNARITDIAAEARVGHGTFYTHFESKEEIFIAVLEPVVNELLAATKVQRQPEENPVVALGRANQRYLEAYYANEQIFLLWEQVAAFVDEIGQLLERWRLVFVDRAQRSIRRFQSEGLADTRLDPLYTAHALTGMVRQFALTSSSRMISTVSLDLAVTTLTLAWANALNMPPELVDEAMVREGWAEQ